MSNNLISDINNDTLLISIYEDMNVLESLVDVY
jgi:hypothetical protein